jgi:predicted GIY-YIG superfamily endonuclease
MSTYQDSTLHVPPIQPNINPAQPSYLYLIAAGSHHVKIGISDNPSARLRELQTAHYERLQLTCTVECKDRTSAFALEKALHKWYAECRSSNEWFEIDPQSVLDQIKLMALFASVVTIEPPDLRQLYEQATLIKQLAEAGNASLELLHEAIIDSVVREYPQCEGMSAAEITAMLKLDGITDIDAALEKEANRGS